MVPKRSRIRFIIGGSKHYFEFHELSLFSGRHLFIYAPADKALDSALALANLNHPFAFTQQPELGYSLLMRSMSKDSCQNDVELITSLLGTPINCSGTLFACLLYTSDAADE